MIVCRCPDTGFARQYVRAKRYRIASNGPFDVELMCGYHCLAYVVHGTAFREPRNGSNRFEVIKQRQPERVTLLQPVVIFGSLEAQHAVISRHGSSGRGNGFEKRITNQCHFYSRADISI